MPWTEEKVATLISALQEALALVEIHSNYQENELAEKWLNIYHHHLNATRSGVATHGTAQVYRKLQLGPCAMGGVWALLIRQEFS